VSPDRKAHLILLFGQNTDHSFVPVKVLTAVARSGGQEPTLGQRSEGRLLTAASSDISNNPFAAFVTEASKRFGVPEHWIRAVLQVESGGKLRARSQKGAPGLGVTGDGSSVAGETQAYVATLAPMIESIRTGGKIAAVAKSFTWAAHCLSLCALRASQPSAERRMVCA
jgi:hypothetical protein